jgi:hypothetical protein
VKDTGFNVGPHDVSVDVEVNPDEFSLREREHSE